jgi:methyl-accepting chemotaxis protein
VREGVALQRILAQVNEINQVVEAIAVGAKEQSRGLDEVNSAIGHMDQVTQQNAAAAEESTAASRTMSNETAQLAALVGQFQVGRPSAAEHTRAARPNAASAGRGGRAPRGQLTAKADVRRPVRRVGDGREADVSVGRANGAAAPPAEIPPLA